MRREEFVHSNNMSARCRLLPRDMRPSKKAFERLGFIFQDFGDTVVMSALLPEGWSMEQVGVHESNILDETGKKRATCFYDPSFKKRNGHMELTSEEA